LAACSVTAWTARSSISRSRRPSSWLAFRYDHPPFFVERLWPASVDAKRLRFAGPNLATMLADTMVPEALEHARQAAGLATTLGFVVAFGIAQLEPPADRKEGLSEP